MANGIFFSDSETINFENSVTSFFVFKKILIFFLFVIYVVNFFFSSPVHNHPSGCPAGKRSSLYKTFWIFRIYSSKFNLNLKVFQIFIVSVSIKNKNLYYLAHIMKRNLHSSLRKCVGMYTKMHSAKIGPCLKKQNYENKLHISVSCGWSYRTHRQSILRWVTPLPHRVS